MKLFLSLLVVSNLAQAEVKEGTIIYGEDNRVNISDVQDLGIQALAKSIAGRVQNFSFKKDDLSNTVSFDFVPVLSDPTSMRVCSGERFANQKTAADCTGFLVGEDLLVTAGHCVLNHGQRAENDITRDCVGNSWMFDFNTKTNLESVSADNIYGCKEVLLGSNTDEVDFALIRLDRKVVGRKPLKLAKNNPGIGQKLFVMGHPSGLPLKYADGARIFEKEETYFATNLDTFGGNSGSPVFNADTLEVEGILVRGDADYVMDFEENGQRCRKVNTCDNNRENCQEDDPRILGEHVTFISFVTSEL